MSSVDGWDFASIAPGMSTPATTKWGTRFTPDFYKEKKSGIGELRIPFIYLSVTLF